ncbi:3'(2'),5'-bisphosphate nucleotidase CysQ family protein [Acinetobacter puyangensis]|uniref:3'(2'),5'-bisphosphate nucleotidase CysQ family protein n=1 Tax=Acinetobacter puyangensis TaxID=1096779 RepID=UPI003A4E11C2
MFKDVALQQMSQKLQHLCEILRQASQILCQEYQSFIDGQQFNIEEKKDHSPVTQADIKANDYITAQLRQNFPDLPILSEEGLHQGRQNWQTFWLLDPLDGTKEFIDQTGEFTINLSLINAGESVISAIAVPLQHTIYIGEQGDLPFKWQWQQEQIRLMKFAPSVSQQDRAILRIAMSRRPERSALYAEFLHYLQQQHIEYQKVAAGSAYKFCMMLEDQIDVYPRFHPTSEWDIAAGQGLLQSIGGNVFDLNHQPFQYNQRASLLNGNFIALRQIQDWSILADFLQGRTIAD